jgi:hypothetical protein
MVRQETSKGGSMTSVSASGAKYSFLKVEGLLPHLLKVLLQTSFCRHTLIKSLADTKFSTFLQIRTILKGHSRFSAHLEVSGGCLEIVLLLSSSLCPVPQSSHSSLSHVLNKLKFSNP